MGLFGAAKNGVFILFLFFWLLFFFIFYYLCLNSQVESIFCERLNPMVLGSMTTWFGLHDQQAVQLRQAYDARCGLFFVQPSPVKQFFIAQSQILAEAFLKEAPLVNFQLPEQVVCEAGGAAPLPVPEKQRHQKIGSRVKHFRREAFLANVSQHLSRLEESPDRAVSVAASLIRLSTVLYMVQGMLPNNGSEPLTAIIATTDASLCSSDESTEKWDSNQPALENSLKRSAAILAMAARFAPYIVSDEGYQLQCTKVLSTLVQQGQAASVRQMQEIIDRLRAKAAAHELDRGLSLSLPYFNDRKMDVCLYDFEVIPVGRIPFDPRWVMMAARAERDNITTAMQFSPVTRKHLLAELMMLEAAFCTDGYPASPGFKFY